MVRNNFDFLRLILASTVFLVHSYELSKDASLEPLTHYLSSKIAVEGFFVVSGYLICASFSHSSMGEYFSKRVRRIIPAYIAVILVCAAMGTLLSQYSYKEYFSSALVKYVLANLGFLNFLAPTLPGVFDANLVPAVNGALWTIKIELAFYFTLPILVFFLRLFDSKWLGLLILYSLSLAYALVCQYGYEQSHNPLFLKLAYQFPGQLIYFVVGMAGYYYREFMHWHCRPFAIVAILAVMSLIALKLPLLEPVFLGLAVLAFALCGKYLGNFARFGDFSYGIYIWHFPVIQTFLALGILEAMPLARLAVSGMVVLGLAILSWHCVEKRFLLRSSHYKVASN